MKRLRQLTGLIILLLVFVGLICGFFPWLSRESFGLTTLIKVPLRVINYISYDLRDLARYRSLRRENKVLRKTVDILTRQIVELEEASIENERLRGLLSFKKETAHELLPAAVIGRDTSNWSKTILINKGSEEDVKVDMSVVTDRGLVGKVIEVGSLVSKVILIIDPDSRVGVVVQRSRVEGLVLGAGVGIPRMEYIELDADVQKGDLVLTSGIGGVYPKGLIVGEVLEVGKEGAQLYRYAVIRPAVDFSRLEEVLVYIK